MAASALLAAGITSTTAQVALGSENICTITSDGSDQTLLRSDIEELIANINCDVLLVNGLGNAPLDLTVSGTALRIGAADVSGDTRRSFTIKSTSGLNVKPGPGDTGNLFDLEDNSFETITIQGLTFRDAENAAIDGLAFDGFGATEATLRIQNSRFINNGSNVSPVGAIQTRSKVEIVDSIFSNNVGSAVRSLEDVSVSGSLFLENVSIDLDIQFGGAISSVRSVYSVNSTYLNNNAYGAGAIYSQFGNVELVHNTFSGNESILDGESVGAGNDVSMWGNIFVGSGDDEVFGDNSEVDLGYNLADSDVGTFTATTSRVGLAQIWNFGTAPTSAAVDRQTPVRTAPVIPLMANSVAVNFVRAAFPGESFSDFLSGKTSIDQLGKTRSGAFDAGAHERRTATGGFVPVAVQTEPKTIMVSGFAANSAKLTRPMRAEIRKFLRANPSLSNVVCRGFTSSPAAAKDRALGRNRGKVACDYIKTLRPEAKVTIRSGSHTNKPGSQIRRVSITLR